MSEDPNIEHPFLEGSASTKAVEAGQSAEAAPAAPTLRCNRCDKPISPSEAVLTPTGYRCRECINTQQKVFDTSKGFDLPLAFIITGLLSFAGSWLPQYLGFISIFVATSVGLLSFNLINRLIKHRRNRRLKWVMGAGALLGALPLLLVLLLAFFGAGLKLNAGLMPLVWQLAYTVLASSSAYAQAKI